MQKNNKKQKGFTLIEILIVIGILAILASVVIIAMNPARQFAQARNSQRRSDINAILNAVHQNMVENEGTFDFSDCGALSFPSTATEISSASTDLCDCLVPTYIAEMPYDPEDGSYTSCGSYSTGYNISSSTTDRITVSAPSANLGKTIEVTR